MTLPAKQRLDYLDAVRGFALILGIIFHASLSFMPVFIGWAVMDISTSNVMSTFVLISHSFRMEVFFLIAGFFSHMTFHRRGMQAFIQSRLVRIAIPFLLGWFLLRPLLVSGWIMGAESMRGEVDIIAGLTQAFALLKDDTTTWFVGTHLWFLYYLIMVAISVVVLRQVIFMNTTLAKKMPCFVDKVVQHIAATRLVCVAVIAAIALCLWYMQNWGMDTPDKSLLPHVPVALVYGGFFLFGWLLHRQPQQLDRFAKLSWAKSVTCVGTIVLCTVLSPYAMQQGHPQYVWLKLAFVTNYAVMMWLLVSIFIGVCQRLFSRNNSLIRYIADSSYWLYLVHLPIVIWLQIALAELPLHWSLKLIAICTLTIGMSLLVYDLLVRPTIVGKVLNGNRRRSVIVSRLFAKTASERHSEIG